MLEYIRWLAVENAARYFPEPTPLYSLHSYGVILVLEVGDHTLLHFSKSKLPTHPQTYNDTRSNIIYILSLLLFSCFMSICVYSTYVKRVCSVQLTYKHPTNYLARSVVFLPCNKGSRLGSTRNRVLSDNNTTSLNTELKGLLIIDLLGEQSRSLQTG